MQIGLIGGIGPAAQDYYTRRLIALFAEAGEPLDMTTAHASASTVLSNLAADNRIEQAATFAGLAQRLHNAGAGCVAVTSIAGHFCRAEFAERSPLPVIDMIDAVARHVAGLGLQRIGILGTGTVMHSQFYGGILTATVIPPPHRTLDSVHHAYAEMATTGAVTTDQRRTFEAAAQAMMEDDRADAILLGGTDLTLVFDAKTSIFPLIDSAAIHAQAIADYAKSSSVSS